MKLTKKQMVLVSFMLFSLFFGAGNLMFPTFLGKNAATNTPLALLGFLIPAVVLPVLGVIIVAKFAGLENLASKVNKIFAVIFTIIILLSIGPGLGIPRAASVPFEMAILPYLGAEASHAKLYMLIYSLIFFAIALWLALTPSKLVNRIGHVLTPTLLALMLIVFVAFLIKGETHMGTPNLLYQNNVFLNGFIEGYQTMDTIAALNFGLVISNTLFAMGMRDNDTVVKHTVKAGIVAGTILTLIYCMLAYMGMSTSGMYGDVANGAIVLRQIIYQVFGKFGAIFMSSIFTLACLTTCIGLITSIAQYFSKFSKKFTYRVNVVIITVVSFLICNLGLNMILSISIPVLNAIYPVSIVLILLGLFDKLYKNNKFIYPITIYSTGVISIIYALDELNVPLGFISKGCKYLLGYDLGFGWVTIAVLAIIISLILGLIFKNKKKDNEELNLQESE